MVDIRWSNFQLVHCTIIIHLLPLMISIQGLDKVELLKALWLNQKSAAFFGMSIRPPAFDAVAASEAVIRDIDYFCGRAIKMNLSGDTISPRLYDRDAGEGACARVVEKLKDGGIAIGRDSDTRLSCPDGSGRTFVAFGGPMLPDKPDTVLCGNCPNWLRAHAPLK